MSRRSVILSGPLGSGKSTIEAWLAEEYQYRRPSIFTTRTSSTMEPHVDSVSEEEFVQLSRNDMICLPMKFGENWYGYKRDSWKEAISGSSGWVFNLRPYTGLLVRSIVSDAIDIWIQTDEHSRAQRIEDRNEERDKDGTRNVLDAQELAYRTIYRNVIKNHNISDLKTSVRNLIL